MQTGRPPLDHDVEEAVETFRGLSPPQKPHPVPTPKSLARRGLFFVEGGGQLIVTIPTILRRISAFQYRRYRGLRLFRALPDFDISVRSRS